MTNEQAWRACLNLAKENNWHATVTALSEDGPDSTVDYKELLRKWNGDQKA